MDMDEEYALDSNARKRLMEEGRIEAELKWAFEKKRLNSRIRELEGQVASYRDAEDSKWMAEQEVDSSDSTEEVRELREQVDALHSKLSDVCVALARQRFPRRGESDSERFDNLFVAVEDAVAD